MSARPDSLMGCLRGGRHILPLRVYYEDTDAGGLVYYANYLKFMERARTEWLRSLGFEQDRLRDEESVLFVVRQASLDFLCPARFNDALAVSARVTRRGRASLSFQQQVRNPQNERLVYCSGEVKLACIDAQGFRPRPIPERLLAEMPDVE